jgi:hypothetical protein
MSIRNTFPESRLNPFGASRPGRSVVLVLFRTIRLGEWIFRQRPCTKACHRGRVPMAALWLNGMVELRCDRRRNLGPRNLLNPF